MRGRKNYKSMKKISIISGILLFTLSLFFNSCGKSNNNPVDKYVDILESAASQAEQIHSTSDFLNIQQIISPEATQKIVEENEDYILTDKDKEKLKKSFDKLLKVSYEKTIKYGGMPEEIKKQAKGQMELLIEGANKGIDNAKNLGYINRII